MSETTNTGRRWKQGAAIGAGVALLGTVVAVQGGPSGLSASSHREAPLIAGDPRADNTDVYAFVSPDAPDTVTMIANWLPFEEPNGGPNFYPWAEDTRYNVNVDNDGDAVADLAYTWTFTTVTKDPGQFLVNTGPFSSVGDDTLNVYQTYDLVVRDLSGTPTDESDDVVVPILDDAIAAPSAAGAVSTPDYQPLVDEAVASGTVGDLRSFAGQADDSFFLDLRVFDLLYGANVVPEVGEDTLAGYNVNTIALQVPSSVLALNGSVADNPVIGVWSTTERIVQTEGASTPDDETDDAFAPVQVSRLGNPLVNEVVLPLALKDTFNAIDPTVEATVDAAVEAVQFPILPPLIEAIYGQPVPGDDDGDGDNEESPRTDLVEIFLQGVSVANDGLGGDPNQNPALAADLNDLALNAGVDAATPSEMLRLNMAVPPTASPNDLGVIGGDLQGFPNGRRLTDDVVDIALAVAEGIVFEDGADVSALAPFDSVDRNDRDFADVFPYVALPHLDSVTNGTERTPRAPEYVSTEQTRVLETRADAPGGQVGYSGPKPAGGTRIDIDVSPAVPSDATAVFLSISAIRPDETGYVLVWDDCDTTPPVAASLNPLAGVNVSNLVAAPIEDDGTVCLFTEGSAHFTADVVGYQPSTSSYLPNTPERVLETRPGAPGGQVGYAGAKPAAGQEVAVQVTGTSEAALADDTAAVVLNVTATNPEAQGFITVYPCGQDVPLAANLNMAEGTTRANLVVSQVGDGGQVCITSSVDTDLVVDLQGSYPAGTDYVPVVPERILETREEAGQVGYSGDRLVAGETIDVDVIGVGEAAAPEGTGTVFVNVATIGADVNGFITVYACGGSQPLAASGVYSSSANTSTLVAAPVGDGGRVCLYTSAGADFAVDIVGYFPGTQLVG